MLRVLSGDRVVVGGEDLLPDSSRSGVSAIARSEPKGKWWQNGMYDAEVERMQTSLSKLKEGRKNRIIKGGVTVRSRATVSEIVGQDVHPQQASVQRLVGRPVSIGCGTFGDRQKGRSRCETMLDLGHVAWQWLGATRTASSSNIT